MVNDNHVSADIAHDDARLDLPALRPRVRVFVVQGTGRLHMHVATLCAPLLALHLAAEGVVDAGRLAWRAVWLSEARKTASRFPFSAPDITV